MVFFDKYDLYMHVLLV